MNEMRDDDERHLENFKDRLKKDFFHDFYSQFSFDGERFQCSDIWICIDQ